MNMGLNPLICSSEDSKITTKITINHPKIDDDMQLKIERIITGEEKGESIEFEDYLIYTLGDNYFMLKTNGDNIDVIFEYKDYIDENFKSSLKSGLKEIDLGKQIPENSGFGEYSGNYYIIIFAHNSLTDEINEENGVYKGMIINPEKYYEVKKGIKKVKGEIENVHYINQ